MKYFKRVLALAMILLLLVATSLLLQRCQKPEVFYTISTIVDGKGSVNTEKLLKITHGDNLTIKMVPEKGYLFHSVKINGIKIQNLEPSELEVLYVLKNIESNLLVEVQFLDIRIYWLTNKGEPWFMTEIALLKTENDSILGTLDLDEETLSRKIYYYYPSMDIKIFEGAGSLHWYSKWGITDNVYKQGGQHLTILEMTPNKFVFKAIPVLDTSFGFSAYAKYTYVKK